MFLVTVAGLLPSKPPTVQIWIPARQHARMVLCFLTHRALSSNYYLQVFSLHGFQVLSILHYGSQNPFLFILQPFRFR